MTSTSDLFAQCYSDSILSFYERLCELNVEFYPLTDHYSKVDILICRNTLSIRRRLELPSIPSTQPGDNKLAVINDDDDDHEPSVTDLVEDDDHEPSVTDLVEDDDHEPSVTDLVEDDDPLGTAPETRRALLQLAHGEMPRNLTCTTTSRNKTALRRRREQQDPDRASKKRRGEPVTALSAMLVSSSSSNEEEEEGRFADPWFLTIMPMEQAILARTQHVKMIKMARAIAGRESSEDWQMFMVNWRQTTSADTTYPGHLEGQPQPVLDFCRVYQQLQTSEVADSFTAIRHRIYLLRLWQHYEAIGELDLRSTSTPGQTSRSVQKRHLFHLLHPRFEDLLSPRTSTTSQSAWTAFTHRLGYASRWHAIRQALGLGVLGLIPNRVVSNTWVQELKVRDLELWIRVIQHFNPACIASGHQWTRTLIPALARRSSPVDDDLEPSSSQAVEQFLQLAAVPTQHLQPAAPETAFDLSTIFSLEGSSELTIL